jgi:hypothetical protein
MLRLCLLLSAEDGHESKIGLDKKGKFFPTTGPLVLRKCFCITEAPVCLSDVLSLVVSFPVRKATLDCLKTLYLLLTSSE